MKDSIHTDRIVKYAKKINKYTDEAKTMPEFKQNEEKIDAVIFNLERIGETAKKLSSGIKQRYPAIDWPNIIR